MKIKRRTIASLRVWGVRAGIVVLLVSIFFIYAKTDIFSVQSFSIEGVDDSSRLVIEKNVKDLMTRNVYYIIPGNKIFTYNSEAIVEVVRKVIPDTSTVEIRPVGLHVIKITTTVLTPLFRIGENQAVTNNGIVFSTKKNLNNYTAITFASSTLGKIKIHGLVFDQLLFNNEKISEEFFLRLAEFSEKVNSIIFPVRSILVESAGDITLYSASSTSKIFIVKDQNQKKTWSTLVSAIDTDPLKSKLANEKDKLEYLDVRYGNKVFYRFSDMPFQNTKGAAIMDNHATTTQVVTATTSSR